MSTINLFLIFFVLLSQIKTQTWQSNTFAYIYPGTPGCDQAATLQATKPKICSIEYFTTTLTGSLVVYTETLAGCFGFTNANAALVRQNCEEAFITISADEAGKMEAVVANPTVRARNIQTMKSMLDSIGFDGIELNFEASSAWSATGYSNFKQFLRELKAAIAPRKVIFTFPSVLPEEEALYPWRYADMEPLLDLIVIMGYDNQYDTGSGNPIAPYAWTRACLEFLKSRIGATAFANKVIWGVNSYGYVGTPGTFNGFRLQTYNQMVRLLSQNGLSMSQGSRDASGGDIKLSSGGLTYYWVDVQSMNAKRQFVEGLGAKRVGVWHLGGGNPWFTGTEPATIPSNNGGGSNTGGSNNGGSTGSGSGSAASNGTNFTGQLRADQSNFFSFIPSSAFRVWARNATAQTVAVKVTSNGGVTLADIDVFLYVWDGSSWTVAASQIGAQNDFTFTPKEDGWYMYSIVNRGASSVNYEFALKM